MVVSAWRARAAVGAAVVICGWLPAACGSSGRSTHHAASPATGSRSTAASGTAGSNTVTSTASTSPGPPALTGRRVQEALLAKRSPPRPTSASCRPATAAERSAAPFGHTSLPVFVCVLAVDGRRARFDVQVLNNGCYVAERTTPGLGIYGCGVRRS